MMKLIYWILFVLPGFLLAQEMEVRSYQVGEKLFFQVHYEQTALGDPFEVDDDGDGVGLRYLGKVLNEAPFESRFFEGAGKLKDCSKGVGELLNEEEWEGQAVLDVNDGELVVKAEAGDHRKIAEIFEERVGGQIEVQVWIYRVKGVTLGARAREVDEVLDDGEILAGLSFLQLPGVTGEAREGGLSVSCETQFDHGHKLVESRVEWKSTIQGAEFEVQTGFSGKRGEPVVVDIGSSDGTGAVVAVLTIDRVLFNGVKFDEWILKEKGGAFLREERLALGRKSEGEDEGRQFTVPPSFATRLRMSGAGGVKDLLKGLGVVFGEGDFANFLEKSSTLLVKASPKNLELVEAIVEGRGWSPPSFVRLGFVQVESVGEIDRETLEKGAFQIRKKIGVDVIPGQVGKVRLGKMLTLEAEAQIDGNNELIEMRATLSERGNLEEASLKTGLTLRAGKPVVVQQSRRGEKWVAWVATAEVITVGEEIE